MFFFFMFHSQDVISDIEEKALAIWSPEQIAGAPAPYSMSRRRKVCRWLCDRYLYKGNLKVLRRKGKIYGIKAATGESTQGP